MAYTVVAQGEWLSGSINWVSKGEDGRVSGGQERGADGMGSRNQQQAGGWRAPGGRPGPGESVRRGGERQGSGRPSCGIMCALAVWKLPEERSLLGRSSAEPHSCSACGRNTSRAGTALRVLAAMHLPPLTACSAQAIASTAADSARSSPRAPEKEVHPGEMHPWE